jgi:fluoride exporter
LNVLFVAIGSAAGGVLRWLVGDWVQRAQGGAPPSVFPLGTLVVNATGSFVLGVLAVMLAREAPEAPSVTRLLLAVGFCGGYTTFSTFSLDTMALLETRGGIAAAVNVVASVSAGLIGVVAGMLLGRTTMARFA